MTDPSDWGVRFQELSAEAGQTYARSLRRYNELLSRVARGELHPDDIQRQFRDYVQERSTTSTRELVELSVGLLAGLLHVEARYRDALLDGLLPPQGPPAPPPSPETIDLANWFQTLAKYAAEQSARSMARHQQLVDKVAAGEIQPGAVQEQGRRFLESHAPMFLGDVMALGLDFVGRLQQSSATLADGLYDRVLGPEGNGAARPEPPICVDLRGTSGSIPTASLVVENTRLQSAEVVCVASEFAPRSGGQRFRPALEIVPARFSLAPGEHRDVDIRLPLEPTRFAPGVDYVATLSIAGAGEHELLVRLLARADTAARAEAAATASPATPAPPSRARSPRSGTPPKRSGKKR
jgi:hypothetical protein